MVKTPAKWLRTSGAKVVDVTLASEGEVVESCASVLMEKFANMSSKFPSKSG